MLRSALWTKGSRLALAAAFIIGAGAGAKLFASGPEQDALRSAPPLRLAQAAPPVATQSAPSPFDASQKAAIEAIIKEYLLSNPEVMLEVQSALEEKMEAIQAGKLKAALSTNAAEIYRDPGAPVAGNPSGDVPVVEFFDYNCGYCKRAFSDISKAIEADGKIKLILKELPILSKGSEEGARVALAARKQGKYWQVHSALLSLKGEVNEQSALRAAEKVGGVDIVQLKKDMGSEEVTGEINRVRELAQKMGIQGTPHFLIGDRAIAGAPGNLADQIKEHAAAVRKDGCSVC